MKKLFTLLLFLPLLSFYTQAQVNWNMELLGQLDDNTLPEVANNDQFVYNDIWGYAAEGREYALIGSAAFVHFIDVTDPTNPILIDQFEGGDTTVWRDMKTFGEYAYAVSDGTAEGMMVFDLSDLPNTVTKVNQVDSVFSRSHNIYIDEANGRLYACGTNAGQGVVLVYDIETDSANPQLIGNMDLGSYVHDLYVRDNIAYCSHGWDGYKIWDYTDAAAPQLIASRLTNGYNHSSWVSDDGSWAIFAEEVPQGLPLGVMDLSQLNNEVIEVETFFQFPLLPLPDSITQNTPHNPFLKGDFAFSSYYEDGVQIFDMSDPSNPQLAGWYDTYPNNTVYTGYFGCWGVYPYLPSGNIIASDRKYGLHVLSFNEPSTSTEELSESGFDIFPNPSRGIFNILMNDFGGEKIEFDVFDLSGKILQSRILSNQSTSIDLSYLPSGFYFGKIRIGNKEMVKKLVIAK